MMTVLDDDSPDPIPPEDRVVYTFRAHKAPRGWDVQCPECGTMIHAGQKKSILAVARKHGAEACMGLIEIEFA